MNNIKQEKQTKVVSRKNRRWPDSEPAKNGSLNGHCMNND